MSKQALYGVLDPNTREWRDGLFTSILRKIIDNVRGEINKRQWIIFDGDVDPDWVENINYFKDPRSLSIISLIRNDIYVMIHVDMQKPVNHVP